jgi:biotin carboxyl carrier protein
MGSAKVVALRARPWKVTQLCFEVGGVLQQIPATLGASVTPFSFTSFYSGLLSATVPGNPSLLAFNSQGILNASSVAASLLANLRAEPKRADLDMAVNARQNAYFAKYGNTTTIISTMTTFYGTGATAKPQRLVNLSTYAQQQSDQLAAAYTSDGRTGVIKNTNSVLNATTTTTDSSSSNSQSSTTTTTGETTTESGQTNLQVIGGNDFSSVSFAVQPPPPAGGVLNITPITGTSSKTFEEGTSGDTSNESGTSNAEASGQGSSTGQATALESQTIVNTDYGYRVPSIESLAQNERAQVSLIDQQFAQFMRGQNLPNLATVFQNELSSIDRGVYQLQVGFLNTILLSPIAGTVTGVYKNPGDCVRPGEPIVRVEDNSTLFVLGTLIYRSAIHIGSSVTITTVLFDAAGSTTTLTGSVVAVRNGADDDQWEVVVQCTNPNPSGTPVFPIGYTFDYDNTTVTVV